MNRIIVTGANGFTGSHLMARLRDDSGLRVAATRDGVADEARLDADEVVACDVTRWSDVESVIQRIRPTSVYHLAGTTRGSLDQLRLVNTEGTENVLRAVRRFQPKCRVLVVGSSAEYGKSFARGRPVSEIDEVQPMSNYGVSKRDATDAALMAARDGMSVVIARPFNLVGSRTPSTTVVGAVIARARQRAEGSRRGITVPVGNTGGVRDFLAIEDAVDAYVKLMASEQWGEVFNICSGVGRTVADILAMLVESAPWPLSLSYDPALSRTGDIEVAVGSYEKAKQAIGFQPQTPIEVALRAAWVSDWRAKRVS